MTKKHAPMIFGATMFFLAAYAENGMCQRTHLALKAIDDGSQSTINHRSSANSDIDENRYKFTNINGIMVSREVTHHAVNVKEKQGKIHKGFINDSIFIRTSKIGLFSCLIVVK
jgi:hypothetical protein